MSQTSILLIAVIVVLVILALWFLTRGRKQSVSFSDAPADVPMAPKTEAKPIAKAAPAPTVPAPGEGHGVGSEVTAAIEDVVDQFVGIQAHPSGQELAPKAGDDLTRLKGLGPKAASRLNEIGVTTFAQIAAWDEGDIDAIDAQLGAFKGRIRRDRWVDQAKYLAKGDVEGFETAFGKLG